MLANLGTDLSASNLLLSLKTHLLLLERDHLSESLELVVSLILGSLTLHFLLTDLEILLLHLDHWILHLLLNLLLLSFRLILLEKRSEEHTSELQSH